MQRARTARLVQDCHGRKEVVRKLPRKSCKQRRRRTGTWLCHLSQSEVRWMVSERVQGSVQAEQGSVVPPCSKGSFCPPPACQGVTAGCSDPQTTRLLPGRALLCALWGTHGEAWGRLRRRQQLQRDLRDWKRAQRELERRMGMRGKKTVRTLGRLLWKITRGSTAPESQGICSGFRNTSLMSLTIPAGS